MILKQEINTNNKRLLNIISEHKKHILTPEQKANLLHVRIEERLNKSLREYYNRLTQAFDKLVPYNDKYNLRVMKRLNKE